MAPGRRLITNRDLREDFKAASIELIGTVRLSMFLYAELALTRPSLCSFYWR